MLIYPTEDVKEYIALNWAKECVSKQWLVFDDMYRERCMANSEMRAQGFHVNSLDIRKHRLDVFRIFPLIREDLRIPVPSSVGEDIQNFIAQIRETDISLTDIVISRSKDSILYIYNNMYIVD